MEKYEGLVADNPEIIFQPFGVDLHEVQERRITWMSHGRLAHGKMTDLSGDPGQGKTMMTLDWCARYSRGEALPDGEPDERRHVVYMSIEDDVEDTLVPRLRIAGADLTQITVVNRSLETGGFFHFPDDLGALVQLMDYRKTGMVCIDPMAGFLASGKAVNNTEDVRHCYQPLVDAIKKPGIGVLALRHLNKNTSAGSAMYRGAGSMQITAVVRAGLTVARSQKNPAHRVLAQNKENLSRRMPSLVFEFEPVPGEDHPRVNWLGETDEGADELLMDPRERQEIHDAKDWLLEALSDGQQPGKDLIQSWKQQGTERAIREAARKLDVQFQRDSYGPGSKVWWSLPKPAFSFSKNGSGLSDDFPEE